MTTLIHAFAAASLLAGCAAAPSEPSAAPATPAAPVARAAPVKETTRMSTTVTLLPEHSATLGAAAKLHYDSVADSRCPPNVQCISAGEVRYNFTLMVGGANETFSLTKNKPTYDANSLPGLQVALGDTAVPPVQATNAPAPLHPVTLTLTRK